MPSRTWGLRGKRVIRCVWCLLCLFIPSETHHLCWEPRFPKDLGPVGKEAPCQRASWRGVWQRGQRAQLRSNYPKGLGKSTLQSYRGIRATPRQVVASGTAVMFSASGRGARAAAQGLTWSRRQRGGHCPGDSKARHPTSPGRRGAGRGGHCSQILSTVMVVILAKSVFLLSDTWMINQALHRTLMSRQASDTKRNVV